MTVAFGTFISCRDKSTKVMRSRDEQTAKRHLGQERQSSER